MNGWSGRSLASRGKHQVFYTLLKYLGLKPAKVLLFFIVLFYSITPGVYHRGIPYLERRFGSVCMFRRYRQIFLLYWNFGRILLERAAGGILGNIDIESLDEDLARLRGFSDAGRGVILLSAHAGFWQLSIAGLGGGAPLNVFYRKAEGDVDMHHFEHGGAMSGCGVTFIRPEQGSSSSIAVASALMRGEIVCMTGDRVLPGEGATVRCEFLGGEIELPGIPYLLASITGCPIMVSLVRRTGSIRGLNRVYKIIEVPPKLPRTAEALRPYARMYAEALEEYVQAYPYQFFNIFNMWVN